MLDDVTVDEIIERYERLMEISRNLNSTLALDSLLEKIVVAAAELTDSDASSILLVDKRTGVLRFEAALDTTGVQLSSIEVPLEGSIAGWVVQNNETLVIEDVESDPRFFKGVDEESTFRTRNILAVPMEARGKVIGCLEALNKMHDDAYDESDVSILVTMAAQAAVAIENARLFEQSDLIKEMVHELRTPLAAIKATTYLIPRKEISEEKRLDLIATIQRETDRLTRMTTEFLDLARLESGRTHLKRDTVDLNQVLNDAIYTVHPQADDKSVNLDLVTEPETLPNIIGDDEKLKQVLLNLLTNAIKYNREHGTVTLRARRVDNSIQIDVEDTGLGISKDNLPHIFEKFFRVADTEGYTQGTGLGLAIAKRIIEGHGGNMTVDSEEGVGTTFTFTLPLPHPH
ncbi:MAG: GAF domain-containing sensor histidine kinase [Chloroflexi bacterium]|nr:GAF domain-containing sensor histidine kinase [Chloroflexota bacterium]